MIDQTRAVVQWSLQVSGAVPADDGIPRVSFVVSSQVAVDEVEGAGFGMVARKDLEAGEGFLVLSHGIMMCRYAHSHGPARGFGDGPEVALGGHH